MKQPTGIRDKNGIMIFYGDIIIYNRRKFQVQDSNTYPVAVREDLKHIRLLERIADRSVVKSDNVVKMVF